MEIETDHGSRRALRRLLFVEAPADTPVPETTAHADFVLTALLRRGDGQSRQAFLSRLERSICEKLAARKQDYGLRSLRLLSAARFAGLLRFFLQFTRSRLYTAWLCRIVGRPEPEPYRIRYGPLYDAVLHVTFAEIPIRPQLDSVLAILRDQALDCAERKILPSERQYTIYDARSSIDEAKRVNICFLVRRPAQMTRRECQHYWCNQHASLALRNMRYLGLTRYLQIHTAENAMQGLDDDFDGVVYAEKSSLVRLVMDLMKPDSFRFNNTVVIDETHFTFCTPIMLLGVRRTW